MLAKARVKLPQAQLFLADLRAPLPPELNRRFDRIISGYTFHHFELDQKIEIIQNLMRVHLAPDGRLLIADIAFPHQAALEIVKRAAGDEWEDEFYWLADETLPAVAARGLQVQYTQISICAGVFLFS